MSPDASEPNVIALWQNQKLGREQMAVEEVRSRLAAMDARAHRRRVLQLSVLGIAVCGTIWVTWRMPVPMMRIGALIVMATTLLALFRSVARGRVLASRADLTAATCRSYLLSVLVDRRDATRRVLHWQVVPTAAGMAVFLLGMYLDDPRHWQLPAGVWLVASLQTGVARWRLERSVRRYDSEIAALQEAGPS